MSQTMGNNKVSIIMAAYNEKETILQVIEKVKALPIEKEIIIVDDGSTDGTTELLESMPFHRENNLFVIYSSPNKGKGHAVKEGLKNARGDIVIFQDADLELDPLEIPKVLEPIFLNKADVVFGSRFLSNRNHISIASYFANWFLTLCTNFLYGLNISDMETAYKAFRRELLDDIILESNEFDIEPELTAKLTKLKCRFAEVPISFNPRSAKDGKKIHWHQGFKALLTLLRYKFRS